MRRSRIQVKPNVAKGAKQTTPAPTPVIKHEESSPAPVEELPAVPSVQERSNEGNTEDNPPVQTETLLDPPSESMRTLELDRPHTGGLFVDVKTNNHHVHFTDDVIDNEQNRGHETPNSIQTSPSIAHSPLFATPHPPSRLMTPRSRNVSMCEDESILQPKQSRDKRRLSGKQELDTKTWKMSDLTRWNPRNEHTSFKRERRSSTSSTIITKSEAGDPFIDPPRVNAPQVKLSADGRLVIDESSLVMQSAQVNHESVWETVEEGRMGSKITSMSFRSRIFRKPTLWSPKETDLFYEVLQCTGTDFGLMHHYLPQRSRPELKAKYNKEEKCNWERLFKVTSHPVRLDGTLEERIAKIMADIEGEIQEKKARNAFEKAEEKRVRIELREQKATEKVEEQMKKAEARELVKQAKELERGARIAAKSTERAEREAKIKERMDAKQMAIEAKRIATEARAIIREARHHEVQKKDYHKRVRLETDQDTLEREAERIIRRLVQETRREEREKKRVHKEQKKKEQDEAAAAAAKEGRSETGNAPEGGGSVDPPASAVEIDDETSSDSSSSATSSDEDALRSKDARKEKDRMKTERRNLEPRKSVAGKKPIYVDTSDVKYAQQPVAKAIEMAKLANGSMFNSADEGAQVDVSEWPELDQMDTASPGPAPPVPESQPAPSELSPSASTSETAVPASSALSRESPILVVDDDEPIPQSVTDVVEDMARARSKTPMATETEMKRKMMSEDDGEGKNSEEPPVKVARVEQDDVTEMEANDIIDVVTVEEPPSVEISATADDGPSTSSAPEPPAPMPRATRRTTKKPVMWKKKK